MVGWLTRFRMMNRIVRYHTVTRNKIYLIKRDQTGSHLVYWTHRQFQLICLIMSKLIEFGFDLVLCPLVNQPLFIDLPVNLFIMKPTTGAQVSLVYWPGKCAVTQQEMIIFESGRTLFWFEIDMIRDQRERSKFPVISSFGLV